MGILWKYIFICYLRCWYYGDVRSVDLGISWRRQLQIAKIGAGNSMSCVSVFWAPDSRPDFWYWSGCRNIVFCEDVQGNYFTNVCQSLYRAHHSSCVIWGRNEICTFWVFFQVRRPCCVSRCAAKGWSTLGLLGSARHPPSSRSSGWWSKLR